MTDHQGLTGGDGVVRQSVQIGDRARILEKKKKKKKVLPVRQTHRAQLIRSAISLLRDMKSRGREAQPYERRVNRFDL